VAARAVAGALPLLVKADAVTVLTVNPDENTQGPRPGADLAEHLARHGVRADVVGIANSDANAGEIILSEAGGRHADLVVMGGYATSRMREFLLGGATRHVLAKSTIPVLMSH
jgi:nucleotide-binding universal stress UspA family protein